jgi:hypothetical protein
MTRLTKAVLGAFVLVLAGIAVAGASDDDMIIKKSSYDVATTLDRLEKIVEEKGIKVMARVDPAKNA